MGCGGSKSADEKNNSPKARVIFVVGGPGSGKGTQCSLIKEKYGCEHLSTGDILRGVVAKKSHPKWEELDKTMQSGGLVSSADLLEFVKVELESRKGKLILLDGFPRNQENMDEWKNQKLDEAVTLIGTLYFDCSEETMKTRLAGRNEGRADDNEEAFGKRINTFLTETKPVIEKLDNLMTIDANLTKEEITPKVFEELDKKLA